MVVPGCDHGCLSGHCVEGCVPGAQGCDGNDLVVCGADGMTREKLKACEWRCDAAGEAGARCVECDWVGTKCVGGLDVRTCEDEQIVSEEKCSFGCGEGATCNPCPGNGRWWCDTAAGLLRNCVMVGPWKQDSTASIFCPDCACVVVGDEARLMCGDKPATEKACGILGCRVSFQNEHEFCIVPE